MTIGCNIEFGRSVFRKIRFKNITGTVRHQILINDVTFFKIVNKKPVFSGMNTEIEQKIIVLIKLIVFAILLGVCMIIGIILFIFICIVTTDSHQKKQQNRVFHRSTSIELDNIAITKF
jgi:heme/copper-type cytochrome/quinol oxidase subunit 2